MVGAVRAVVGGVLAVVGVVAADRGVVGTASVVLSDFLPPKKFRIPEKRPFFVVVSGATVVVVVDVVGGVRCWYTPTPSGYESD